MYASVMDVACSLVVVVVVVVVVQTQMRKDSKRCASRGHFEKVKQTQKATLVEHFSVNDNETTKNAIR